jgi:hypothetical protein
LAGGDANLYAYVWASPTNLIDPFGLWGFGLTGGGTAVAGMSPFIGAAATASGGYGLFGGGCKGTNIGAFASGGVAFVKPADLSPDANILVGLFGGLGYGGFLTNATNAAELEDLGPTWSFDLGIGLVRISVQTSASSDKWIASLTYGPSRGLAMSRMATTTVADPSSRTKCGSKSSQ